MSVCNIYVQNTCILTYIIEDSMVVKIIHVETANYIIIMPSSCYALVYWIKYNLYIYVVSL